MQGRFPFNKLVKFYTLDRINEAAEDSEKGITIKPIIRLASVRILFTLSACGEGREKATFPRSREERRH